MPLLSLYIEAYSFHTYFFIWGSSLIDKERVKEKHDSNQDFSSDFQITKRK